MILSDRDIRQRLRRGDLRLIPRPQDSQIQPASLDISLGSSFVRYRESRFDIDVKRHNGEENSVTTILPIGAPVTIRPLEFLLGVTLERIELPDDLVARVEGRSSIGRLGLTVHVTAGFIDPGFKGHITLEIANLNRHPMTVYTGMRIAQLAFEATSSPCEVPYGDERRQSKYQDQGALPTPSRIKGLDIETSES